MRVYESLEGSHPGWSQDGVITVVPNRPQFIQKFFLLR